jgi:hypothetical protein
MKKPNNNVNSRRLSSNSRRRQLLKRVHQKVISRRQHFQTLEATEECAQAC